MGTSLHVFFVPAPQLLIRLHNKIKINIYYSPMLFLEDFLELEFDSLLDLLFAAYDEAMDILLSTSGCKCMGTLVISPLSNMAINRS